MQNTVNPALAALLTLRQMAAPTAPGPGGAPVPTVASQTMQQMSAPGLQDTAQQAGIAAPMLAQKEEEDRIASVVQRLQQAQAPQGLAAAPVPDMGFADGGIVGFAGGGANSQEEQDRQAILNALSAVGMGAANLAAAGVDVASVPVRTLGSIYNTISRGHRAFGVPTPLLPKEATMKGLTPAMDVLRRMETPDTGDETERLLTRYPKEVSPAPAPAPASPPAPPIADEPERLRRQQPPPSPRGAAPAAAPAPTSALDAVLQSMLKPTARAQETLLTPEQLYEQAQAARGRYGLTGLPGAATEKAMRSAQAREEALQRQYEESVRSRPLDNLAEALIAGGRGGLRALGKQALETKRTQAQADMAFRKEMNQMAQVREQMAVAVEGMREAAARNDTESYRRYKEEYDKRGLELNKLEQQARNTAVQVLAQQQEGALDRANRLRAAAMTASAARQPPQEIQLMEWLRNPENRKLYSEIMGMRQAPKTRQELMEQWSKNPMLQQKFPKFDDFVALMGSTAENANVPPPDAVKLRGQ